MPHVLDPVTGIPDRHDFMATLQRAVGTANEMHTSLALLVVDIDGFAKINRASGYSAGDRVLRHLAQQLRQVARDTDYVARLGGDRMALILPAIMNQGHAELAIQKLFRLLDLPFSWQAVRFKISVTVGAAICPQHASHPEHLLRQAEKAIDTARSLGQRSAFPPDVGVDEGLSAFWDMEIELFGAVERGEMAMYYQPKVRLPDLRPIGAEALMRWFNRARGAVSPSVFAPIAEQTGQIKPLTIWALNTVLRQASAWKHPWGNLSVSVNVPAELVVQHDLPELVESALRLWGNGHIQLILEITERSLVADPKQSFRILSQVRDLGVKVSIDDFGTGYSCLAYFKDLPVDELKVDQSFVSRLLSDTASADITSLIVELAHQFGLCVVAEGVEDVATLDALCARRCDIAQGFLFGKGMPVDAFEHWLTVPAMTLERHA
ncbi:putative bifunctional diguanylate cyclase/phosphodiesterase [Tahibacter amnicola]|uniref:Bifunctional diguanylate cyclase/phosphodiesterase n=1 Tax=Tahibacter amnicola TaxID=2976241 RepID=A0ABY6BED8_9GAMM|nr:bifunctional diguanylate cyclase/phosphodiesterase [Tahibacter amnicola]UXI68160.1 bifunctional diguanylate cyclase/phosphodiesterase [Tahibacter amnicola]